MGIWNITAGNTTLYTSYFIVGFHSFPARKLLEGTSHDISWTLPGNQHTAQNRAELQMLEMKTILCGICFETVQFVVGDENKAEMKQNQPHVKIVEAG